MFFPTLFQHVLQYIFYLFFLKACLSNKLIQLAKDQVEFSSESIDSWILHVPFHQVLQSIPSPRWRRDVKLPVGQLESPTSWPWIWHSGGGFRWWVVTEPVSDMTPCSHLPLPSKEQAPTLPADLVIMFRCPFSSHEHRQGAVGNPFSCV